MRELADLLRLQAGWCDRLGSALYARLLERAAADVLAGGPVRELLRVPGHDGPIRCVAFAPHGTMLATGGADGQVILWMAPRDGL